MLHVYAQSHHNAPCKVFAMHALGQRFLWIHSIEIQRLNPLILATAIFQVFEMLKFGGIRKGISWPHA